MFEEKCGRCDGCGKIWGEGKDEVPRKVATSLPLESSAAVMMFPPRECPDCGGSGKKREKEKSISDSVLTRIQDERKRQDLQWGEQNHEPAWWLTILAEEFGEAAKAVLEGEYVAACSELVQVAAVAVAAVESIKRNGIEFHKGGSLVALQQEVKWLQSKLGANKKGGES